MKFMFKMQAVIYIYYQNNYVIVWIYNELFNSFI